MLATSIHPIAELIIIVLLKEAQLSLEDDMRIRSSFHYLTHDRFQCEKKYQFYYEQNIVRKKLSEEEAADSANSMLEAVNHCNTMKDEEIYEVDGYSYKTCICNFGHKEISYYLTLFHAYSTHGLLPFSGSISQQPNYIMEVFDLLESLKMSKEENDREKAVKRSK